MMTLIGSLTSPFVHKVRVVMAEKKLECAFTVEDVWSATTTITKVNPLGQVPCLLIDDKEALYDSRVIVEYLDTLSPVNKLIPSSGRERIEVKTWEALADGILDALIRARLEATWPGRTESQRSNAWIERQMSKVHQGLAAMESNLGDKPYCQGVHLTLADLAVGVVLGYIDFRFPELDWRANHPHLTQLYTKLQKRQSFIDTKEPK